MAEHFVQPPHWAAYIIAYFFLAGLAGGTYVLATMLRLSGGSARNEAFARRGYLIAFPLVIVCAILLTLDLGHPLRFWHMLINTTPGAGGLSFKYWSPMSLGAWALLVFGFFSFVSFLEALGLIGGALAGTGGRIFTLVGSLLGLYIASYTGVLISVSNQPVWSDTWTLGGLFLASGLSGSAALLSWLSGAQEDALGAERRLQEADRYFALIELALIVLFFITISAAGTVGRELGATWLILWILVLASLVPPLAGFGMRARITSSAGQAAVAVAARSSAVIPLVVLIGVLLMRIAIVLSAQA